MDEHLHRACEHGLYEPCHECDPYVFQKNLAESLDTDPLARHPHHSNASAGTPTQQQQGTTATPTG